MGYGDEIMAAGEAQVLFDRDPSRRVAICDRRGAVRWHALWDGNPILATPADVAAGEDVQRVTNGSQARPYNARYPFTVQSGIEWTTWRARDHRGRMYLTEAERAIGRETQAMLGPYLVIEPSAKAHNPNKLWPRDRWASLLSTWTGLPCVQPLHRDAEPLDGVTCHLVTETFRDACGLLSASCGYVGTEGGLHHAAAALGVPAVVLYGGNVSVDCTGYPEHVNLVDNDPETPCGRWVPCAHCDRAMRAMTVDRVLQAMTTVWRGATCLA